MFIVYTATSPSNKVYVGITSKGLARRKCQHLSAATAGSDYPFHRAIRKYGQVITWSEVAQFETWAEASSAEQALIAELNSFGAGGYNSTLGGEGQLGRVFAHSDETRSKIKENNAKYWAGKPRSEETKRKCSEAQKGKPRGPFSVEHKAKLRTAALNRYAAQRAA